MKNLKETRIYKRIRDFLHLFGVNKAVFFGVLSKLWFGIAGLVTISLIVTYYSPELQGYYFTFYSLLGLQILVELGLTTVIISFASHEWSQLAFDQNGKIVGDADSLSRLRSLAKIVFKWYIVGSLILLFCMSSVGYVFFSHSGSTAISWGAPWIVLCILVSVQLGSAPAFALLEGCNQVSQVYFFRLINDILRPLATWLIIILGGGLWAPAGAVLITLVWVAVFLLKNYRNYLKSLLFYPVSGFRFNWRNDILPMQWRMAVSFLSGYIMFYLFVPVLFHFKGAVVAGQMGMTWKVSSAILVTASMWIFTRAPQFGILIAQKKYQELDKLVLRTAAMATGVALFGAVTVFSIILFLNAYGFTIASRFLPLLPTAIFIFTAVLVQISYAQSAYLWAHKKQPLLGLAVVTSIIMIFLLWFAGGRWGALGLAVSYLFIVVFLSIPVGTIIWLRCRKSWHYDDEIASEIYTEKRVLDEEENTLHRNG
ncbi:lipopolysaccharide biosynthesis protein [Candidatus Margulisiibacteriota bacterium]